MALPRLTTMRYAALGLLAVRPHSTYELAKAMWPQRRPRVAARAEQAVRGARGSSPGTGTRALARTSSAAARAPCTRSLRPAGARSQPGSPTPATDRPLEFEGLVKLVFADHGTRDDALATVARARAWAVEMNAGNIEGGEQFAEGDGLYDQRRAATLLFGAFLTDFYALVASWADWAEAEVATWPDDIASHRIPPERTREVLDRARWSQQQR